MGTFAASWKIVDRMGYPEPLSTGSHQAITAISATQNYPVGTRIIARDEVLGECEFIYAKGVASTAVGEVIEIDGDFTTTRSATPKGIVGIAMGANVADRWGWYMVRGRGIAKIGADFVAGAAYMSATAGTIQSTAIAGSHLVGMEAPAQLNAGGSAIAGTTDTTAANTAAVVLQYPYCIAAV